MLKVSAFYLEKQKSFIPSKNIIQAVVSKQAKRVPTDGALRSQFSGRFWLPVLQNVLFVLASNTQIKTLDPEIGVLRYKVEVEKIATFCFFLLDKMREKRTFFIDMVVMFVIQLMLPSGRRVIFSYASPSTTYKLRLLQIIGLGIWWIK